MSLIVMSTGMTVVRRDIEWLGNDGFAIALLVSSLAYINLLVWRSTSS